MDRKKVDGSSIAHSGLLGLRHQDELKKVHRAERIDRLEQRSLTNAQEIENLQGAIVEFEDGLLPEINKLIAEVPTLQGDQAQREQTEQDLAGLVEERDGVLDYLRNARIRITVLQAEIDTNNKLIARIKEKNLEDQKVDQN